MCQPRAQSWGEKPILSCSRVLWMGGHQLRSHYTHWKHYCLHMMFYEIRDEEGDYPKLEVSPYNKRVIQI